MAQPNIFSIFQTNSEKVILNSLLFSFGTFLRLSFIKDNYLYATKNLEILLYISQRLHKHKPVTLYTKNLNIPISTL